LRETNGVGRRNRIRDDRPRPAGRQTATQTQNTSEKTMNFLSEEIKFTLVQAAIADGQTDPDSSSVDMEGFDGVMFVGICGTITGSGTITMAAEQSADDSTFNALTGASAVATAAADSDKLLVLDIDKPLDRYVRTALTRAVANSVYGGTVAIQYKARGKPTATAAAQLAAAIVRSATPAEA
jgi:uncharacterized membrane protein YebE (DUF533 family)